MRIWLPTCDHSKMLKNNYTYNTDLSMFKEDDWRKEEILLSCFGGRINCYNHYGSQSKVPQNINIRSTI